MRARIQEADATDLREVPVTELRGLPSLPFTQLDQRLENLRTVDPLDWSEAQERERIIQELLQGDGPMTPRLEAAAKTLGLSYSKSTPRRD